MLGKQQYFTGDALILMYILLIIQRLNVFSINDTATYVADYLLMCTVYCDGRHCNR